MSNQALMANHLKQEYETYIKRVQSTINNANRIKKVLSNVQIRGAAVLLGKATFITDFAGNNGINTTWALDAVGKPRQNDYIFKLNMFFSMGKNYNSNSAEQKMKMWLETGWNELNCHYKAKYPEYNYQAPYASCKVTDKRMKKWSIK